MFTEEDAQDDAKIKREAGPQMSGTAQQINPKIFSAFEDVCDQIGQKPGQVLADMIVKAMNDSQYADTILETEVTMKAIQTGEHRMDDVKYVKEFAEELDMGSDDGDDPIETAIERRLEAVGTSPMQKFRDRSNGKDRQIRELKREIEELKSEISDSDKSPDVDDSTDARRVKTESTGGKKDLDSVFGDSDSDDGNDEEDIDDVDRSDEEGSGGDFEIQADVADTGGTQEGDGGDENSESDNDEVVDIEGGDGDE